MKYFLGIAISILIVGCKMGDKENNQPASNAETGLPEGFDEFYNRFHRDSLFQIEHITFPLQGIKDFADSLNTTEYHYWERDNWVMHKEMDLEEKGFTREIKAIGYMVEETIKNEQNFGTIRRFYFSDGEWKLIYYVGVNLLSG